MSNQYFALKQMRIDQDACAMKVSTDACIQGAWTPIGVAVKNVLDIGTGTGLLSLMLAQRAPQLQIDALEIDAAAALQAAKNVSASPFAQQITVLQADARNWKPNKKYDLIISNPPFFTKSLQGVNVKRNAARHNDTLSQNDLAQMIHDNLCADGYAALLWPISEQALWTNIAETNYLYTMKTLLIKPFDHSAPNRVLIICSKKKMKNAATESLTIYQKPKQYTNDFIQLMCPFYLNL